MGDPVTMAVIGGSIGAAMSPKDPLKGALMGAVGGYGGGAMLGSMGAGATAAAGAVPTAASGGIASTAGTAGLSATSGGVGLTAPASFSGLGLTPAASGLTAGTAALAPPTAMAGVGVAPAAAGGFGSTLAGMGTWAKENPFQAAQMGMAAKDILMPEQQQMPMAPSAGLLRGQQLPQQQSQYAMARPQVSLI